MKILILKDWRDIDNREMDRIKKLVIYFKNTFCFFIRVVRAYWFPIDVVQFQEKFSFLKKVLLPKILLRLPTVHYGCYLQVSLRCELYTVSTTWLFFAISHLAIIMKSDHDQKQPSSTATPYISTVHFWLQKNVE